MNTSANQRSWPRENPRPNGSEAPPDPIDTGVPPSPYEGKAAPATGGAADGAWIQSLVDRTDASAARTQPSGIKPPIPTMEEMERRLIQYALHVNDGSVPGAAGSLGISEATIYRKIKKYKLRRVRD